MLGGFALLLNDRPIRLSLSVQRVVAFLALQPAAVRRTYVAINLWPDSTEERANASLRTALWRLGCLETQVVAASATQLAVAPAVKVDVHVAVLCARRALRVNGPPDSHDVGWLCDLGELLADWYDDWVLVEREHFHQLRLHALESLCTHCASSGRFGDAVEAGLAAVASEPLRESAHRALIAAYLAEDNAADAVRQYSLYRVAAKEHLGLDPSPRMRELVRGLPVR